MIIDKKGKLFGKINVIDLIIVVVLIAAAGIFGYKYLSGNQMVASSEVPATITFYAEEVSDFVLDGTIKEGDVVYDVQEKSNIGTVKSVTYGESVSYIETSDGRWVKTTKPDYQSVTITCEAYGTEFPNGIIIADNNYYIGHTFTIAAGKAKIHLRVFDIEF